MPEGALHPPGLQLVETSGAGPFFVAALEQLIKAHLADLSQQEERPTAGPSLLGRTEAHFAPAHQKPEPYDSGCHTPPLVSPDCSGPLHTLYTTRHPASMPKGTSTTPRSPSNSSAQGAGDHKGEPCDLPSEEATPWELRIHNGAMTPTNRSEDVQGCDARADAMAIMPNEGKISSEQTNTSKRGSRGGLMNALEANESIMTQSQLSNESKRSRSSASKLNRQSSTCSELSGFAVDILQVKLRNSSWSDVVHFTMEDPDKSNFKAFVFSTVMPCLIGLSILVEFVQSIQPLPIDRLFLVAVDQAIGILFIAEVIIRIMVYPNLLTFFTNMNSSQFFFIIDLAAAVPFAMVVTAGIIPLEDDAERFGTGNFLLFCLSPQLRLLKMLRYMPNFHLVSHAASLITEALPSMLVVMIILLYFFSSLLALVEPRENLHSLAHCIWLVVVTMTTVGYGDVFPTSVGGYLVCAVLSIVSLLFMAMPLGIIGNIFTSVWKDRDRILLMKRTRTRLAQWGYTAADIPALFSKFDASGSGELDIFSFHQMIETMNIGFDEKRSEELFKQFDDDDSGTIEASEFVRHLFPRTFHELYGAVQPSRRTTASADSCLPSSFL